MSLKKRNEIIKSDVLIVGGGIGGMQAAITAAEEGATVVVAEKADTRRSGSGATGNDHFMCYIPSYHGEDFDAIIAEVTDTLVGPLQDLDLLRLMMRRSFEVVQKWESYGINMRPYGEDYAFYGHAMPGRRRYHLKYDGQLQKPLLTKEAKKRGVQIVNKTVINQLLTDENGRVIGAIGICTAEDEPEVVIFQAKAVILSTGNASRMYPSTNPAYLFNQADCPATTGSGHAMAYRAGARLVNIDLPYLHAGPKYFARCGKATWIGVLVDYYGRPVGPFVNKPTKELGDATSDIWQGVFQEKMENGSGPVFMNCAENAPEDTEFMMKSFYSEGDTSIVDYLQQYNIDLNKSMIEFGTYDYALCGRGLDIQLSGQTSLEGLYAVGDVLGNVRGDITSAAVFGMISAENAAAYAKTVDFSEVESHPLIAESMELYDSILSRKNGAHWKEANSMLQQIMKDYVGVKVRSKTLLKAGLKYLGDLKRYCREQMKAENAHELMRCLEVLDLLDVAEAIAITSENRKESRGAYHHRSDYTYTNPLLDNKFQTIEQKHGEIILNFRDKVR